MTPAPPAAPPYVTVRFVTCAECGRGIEAPRAYVPGAPRGRLFEPVGLLATCGGSCRGRFRRITFRALTTVALIGPQPEGWPDDHEWPPRWSGALADLLPSPPSPAIMRPSLVLRTPEYLTPAKMDWRAALVLLAGLLTVCIGVFGGLLLYAGR